MDLFIQTLLTVLSFKYKPGKSVGAMVPDTEITNPITTRMAVVITTACQALFFQTFYLATVQVEHHSVCFLMAWQARVMTFCQAWLAMIFFLVMVLRVGAVMVVMAGVVVAKSFGKTQHKVKVVLALAMARPAIFLPLPIPG